MGPPYDPDQAPLLRSHDNRGSDLRDTVISPGLTFTTRSQSFSSGHVWMWELDHKESWVPKNWCFWIVVLEETLESPLDWKDIKPVNLSSLLMHPTEIHLHIPPLLDPLSNVPLTDKDNTGSRRRNQDQQRNRTKASFLILIQKRYQGISLVIITINILPIKKYIVRFPWKP